MSKSNIQADVVRRILEFSDEYCSWTHLQNLRAGDVVLYCGALLRITEDAHRSINDQAAYIARCEYIAGDPVLLSYDYFKAVPFYPFLVVNKIP